MWYNDILKEMRSKVLSHSWISLICLMAYAVMILHPLTGHFQEFTSHVTQKSIFYPASSFFLQEENSADYIVRQSPFDGDCSICKHLGVIKNTCMIVSFLQVNIFETALTYYNSLDVYSVKPNFSISNRAPPFSFVSVNV